MLSGLSGKITAEWSVCGLIGTEHFLVRESNVPQRVEGGLADGLPRRQQMAVEFRAGRDIICLQCPVLSLKLCESIASSMNSARG